MRAPTGCWSAFAVAVAFVAGSAAPARAQSTTLYLNSQAGDYIGGGVSQSYTTADGVFNARSSNGAQHVAISFNTPTYSHWWYLDFAAPPGSPLTAGGYDGATRYPFQSPSKNGLSVDGDGRGCNTLTGRFVVREASYDGSGNVLAFAADFEQHCEGGPAALFGSIRINSSVPIEQTVSVGHVSVLEGDSGTTATSIAVFLSGPASSSVTVTYATQNGTAVAGSDYQAATGAVRFAVGQYSAAIPLTIFGDTLVEPNETFSIMLSSPSGAVIGAGQGGVTIVNDDGPRSLLWLNSQQGDYIGGGIQRLLTEIDGGFAAERNFNQGVDVRFVGDDWWDTDFVGPEGVPFGVGGYAGATRFPFQSPRTPGMDVSGAGRGCNALTGRFAVREAVYDGQGNVQRFAADFEQHCENLAPALYGAIRFNSAVPLDAAVAAGSVTVMEDDPARPDAVFTVFLSAPPNGPVTVDFATEDDTALAGSDYTARMGSLSLGRSALAATVAVPILGDTTPEPTKSFKLALSNARGAALVSVPGVGTILDDDGPKNFLLMNSQAGDYIGQGVLQKLTLADGDFTASRGGNSTVWIHFKGATWWDAMFTASGGATLTPGSYEGGVNFSGDGRGCSVVNSRFVVLEAVYSGDTVQSFAANFEQHCDHPSGPALFGAVRFNSTAGPSADLQTSLLAGGTVPSGGTASMVVAVTNNGPDTANGATVRLTTLPALGNLTWTCHGSGGASCPASGSGTLPALDIPIRGTATLTVEGTVPQVPCGGQRAVAIAAVAALPPGLIEWNSTNDEADGSIQVNSAADLSITKTDGQAAVTIGQRVTYTIVASNAGPDCAAIGASVTDPLPVTLTGASWTCVGAGGGTCTAGGSGSLYDTVDLPVGATVTYTVSATASGSPGRLRNSATVIVPSGMSDSDLANNTATDDDSLVCPPVSVVIADGRVSTSVLGAGETLWLGSSLKIGDSYSLEFKNLTGTGGPPGTATVFAGGAVCGGTSPLSVRDTTSSDPGTGATSQRMSFTATGTATFFPVRLVSSSVASIPYSVRWSDTALYSPAWSTNGSFDTFYSFQNTSGESLNATLTFLDPAGAVLSAFNLSIPAGQALATNTAALATARNRTGTARFTHDGPPGAVVAEAAIANFAISPAYVQSVKFQTVREAR